MFTWIPKGTLPSGSILRSVSIDATLIADLSGDCYASDLSVYLDPTPAYPGNDGVLCLQCSSDYNFGGAAQIVYWNTGDGGVGYTVNETRYAGADWTGNIDLNTVAVMLGSGWGDGTWTGSVTVAYDPPPTVPWGLQAAGGDKQVVLTWAAFPGADSYKVKRSVVTGGPYTVLGTPTATSYTDTAVTNETTYYYVVSAVSNLVEFTYNSLEVSTTPKPVNASASTAGASLPSLWADGFDFSTITVTLKNTNGITIPGKTVTLASNRGTNDTISAASGPSDTNGVVTFTVKSPVVGAAVFTATDTTDSVTLTQTVSVTFVTLPTPVTAYVANSSVLTNWDFHNSSGQGWSFARNYFLTAAGVKLGAPIPGNPDHGAWVGMMSNAVPAGLSFTNSGVEMKYNAPDGPPPTDAFEFLALYRDGPREGFTVGANTLTETGNTGEQGGIFDTWPVPGTNGGLAGPHTLALLRLAGGTVRTYLDGVLVNTSSSSDPTSALQTIGIGVSVTTNQYMPLGSVVSQVRAFTVIPAPTASFTAAPTNGNAPLTVTFTDTSTPGIGSITNRHWSFGDGHTLDATGTSVTNTYAGAGTNTVTLIVSDNAGYSGTNTQTGLIKVLPEPLTALFTAATTNGFAPLPVIFTDTSTPGSGAITNRHWNFGDGHTLDTTGTSVTNTYASAGVSFYSVTLTVSNNAGVVSSLTKSNLIRVAAVPPPTFLDGSSGFSVNPGAGQATFHIMTTNGVKYRIRYKADLLNTNGWAVVPGGGWTNGNNAAITLQDTGVAGVTQRFYRIEATSVDAP